MKNTLKELIRLLTKSILLIVGIFFVVMLPFVIYMSHIEDAFYESMGWHDKL